MADRPVDRPEKTDGHDEPIVVDNGPLSVEFYSPVEMKESGRRWTRKLTRLSHLRIDLTKGTETAVQTKALKAGDEVVIEVAPLAYPANRESLSLSRAGIFGGTLAMKAGRRFVPDTDSQTRVVPVDERDQRVDLRIAKVSVAGRVHVPCVDDSGFVYDSVRVTIVPEPE